MSEPRGRTIPLSIPRRFIADLLHFARKVPSVPVSRRMQLGPLAAARTASTLRPSWPALFVRAYALVSEQHPELRRSWLGFPRARLYEHPHAVCSMAFERDYEGERAVFVGLFRAPEKQSLAEIQAAIDWYRKTPVTEVGFFRQAIRISSLPLPLRRFLWWMSLECSGVKRAKRLGTYGVSTYGSLGAESLHPISPLTTTVTFGPIDPDGGVTVKIIYDHRVLDGAEIARRLADLEQTLLGPVLNELKSPAGAEATVRASVYPEAA